MKIHTLARQFWQCPLGWLMLGLLISLCGCAGHPAMKMSDQARTDPQRALVIATAQRHLGVPYKWGGSSAQSGLDCSGLAIVSYQQVGVALPRSTDAQFQRLPKAKVAKPGDLLFFGGHGHASHVGIFIGKNTMIHAPGKGRRVEKADLRIPYWRDRYLGAGQLPNN